MASGTFLAHASFNRVLEIACMSTNAKMSGRLIAAARALTGISQADFAAAAGLPVETLRLIEASGSARLNPERDVEAVNRAMDHFGVIIIEESDGMGAGVRLKFTRQDVSQIARLEGEGGIVGSDDAP
jgi:transcriptional regulator with XRE-family HTH domain